MNKNILIVSSEYTGHGHKSISEALYSAFEKYSDKVNIEIVNGFSLGNDIGSLLELSYSGMITYIPFLYKIIYEYTSLFHKYTDKTTAVKIEKNFLKLVYKLKPAAVISIHPVFVGSILNILEKNNLKIPFFTVIADLVSFSRLWADKRSLVTICPNEEAGNLAVKFGLPAEKVRIMGFPVRQKFFSIDLPALKNINKVNNELSILFINGSERTGRVLSMAKMLLKYFDCHLTIITGRNDKMKKKLDGRLLPGNEKRVSVLGYIKEIELYLSSHDIAIARGGPNTLMEAVSCCIPIIITGALPGQEEKNPDFMVKRGLGIYCPGIGKMKTCIKKLLEENKRLLYIIKENQMRYRNPESAGQIAELILNTINDL